MGDWTVIGMMAIGVMATVAAYQIGRMRSAEERADPQAVKHLLDNNVRLVDRLMGFTEEGREQTRLVAALEQAQAENEQHRVWRQMLVTTAQPVAQPANEEDPNLPPAPWADGAPRGGV